ncbi:MAG TPA: hypothetical protein VF651_05910 [Gammaproteobacteria bacterium]
MNRHLGFCALTIALSATGCTSTPSMPVARAPIGASCAIAEWVPICDADIRKRFPEILPSDKILDKDFDDSAEPVTATVTYTPEITGPHTVKAKVLICSEYGEGQDFDCHLTRPVGYYDTDPNLYLRISKQVSTDFAQQVIHLWSQGKVTVERSDWLLSLRLTDVRNFILDYHLHGVYVLMMISSGCNGPIYIRIEGQADSEQLRVTRPPEVMCI